MRIEERRILEEEAGVYLKDTDVTETYKELARIGFVRKLRNIPTNAADIIFGDTEIFWRRFPWVH